MFFAIRNLAQRKEYLSQRPMSTTCRTRPFSAEMCWIWAPSGARALLGLLAVDTNARIRDHAGRLMELGVNQKKIAAKMGMKEGTFSKWINEKEQIVLRVTEMDGFN